MGAIRRSLEGRKGRATVTGACLLLSPAHDERTTKRSVVE